MTFFSRYFMWKVFYAFAFVIAGCLLPVSQSLAQTSPDAGSLQQLINREKQFNTPKDVFVPAAPKPIQRKNLGGPKLTVKQFIFVGNTIYPSATIAAVTDSFLHRSIDFSELELASVAVADFYRAAGYVVRTSLPPQDIQNGLVTIEIVEANFGKVQVDGAASKLVDSKRILETIDNFQKSGEKLNSKSIERALALVSDLAGVQIQGRYAEGGLNGQTDLVVSLQDAPRMKVDVSADNSGARSTGKNRIAANWMLNSPWGIGDQMSINLLATEGSEYIRLAQAAPVGYSGWRVGLNTSHLKYKLISQDYNALQAKGTAQSYGVDALYPFLRTRQSNLNGQLAVDRKHYINQTQSTTASDYQSRLVNLGINGSFADAFLGGGKTSLGLTTTKGFIDLSQSATQSSDAATTKTAGNFNKLKYAFARDQELGRVFSLYASVNGQSANKNLDSSEKFYLGGMYGVRAYPTSEAGGSEGQLANLELRSRWGASSTLTGFYDYGRVTINTHNDYSGAPSLNQYALKGYGLAYGFIASPAISLKVTLARRIGNNPNPTPLGLDQDGTLVKTRVWFNANVAF
ncbi:ShlB/FhaC/HecB family hemolysin secretion/activation protein [Limnohabitans sp.]|uniref:ShlB/FhaC/HecB family hemolysin secretion/activation protein n=1 Tax=Limnohabitans sp. TaxID=1907725 RepID=UPI002FDD269C